MKFNFTIMRNALAAWLGMTHDGQRDLYKVFGYPRTLFVENLYALYRRDGIAYRIIDSYAAATWSDIPLVRDEKGNSSEKKDNTGKKNKDYSPFVEDVERLFDEFNVMDYFERADRMSRIGRYGCLLLGFEGESDLTKPVEGKPKLRYLAAYNELSCKVLEWGSDPGNERFGMPILYEVNVSKDVAFGDKALPMQSFRVHWTRMIHMSESLDQDETYGIPALEPVYNSLIDLQKVVGGSSECFWLNANRGIHFNIDGEHSLTDDEVDDAKKQAEEFAHQLRRNVVTQGVTATTLGSDVADVEPSKDAILQLISGSTGIPLRILTGSEAGQLASSQDENNWSDRIGERRRQYAGTKILKPFIQKMIDTGNLVTPKGTWWTEWPETQVSEEKKAAIALQRTQAIVAYSNSPGAPMIVPEQEFRSKIMDLPPVSEYESELAMEQPLPEGNDNATDDPNADPADSKGAGPNKDIRGKSEVREGSGKKVPVAAE